MRPETGAVIGESYTLQRRLAAASWLANTPDGAEYILKFHSGAVPELPQVLHPSLIRPQPVESQVSVRPFLAGWTAREEPPPTLRDSLATGRRLAEALTALHAAGGVHGNIKPSNIVFRQGGQPVLVDATGVGERSEDVRRLAGVLEAWFEGAGISERLSGILDEARSGSIPATRLQEALDDEHLKRTRRGDRQSEGESSVVVASDASTPPEDAPSRIPVRLATSIAVVVALGLLVATLLLLPDAPVETPPPVASPQSEPAPEPEPEVELTEAELEALLAARKAAQAVLDEVINLQLELEEKAVERWAPEAFEQAIARAKQGDEPFREQRYEAAQSIYRQALDQLQAVAARGEQTVTASLRQGRSALDAGDAETAAAAFDLVLAIDPDNETAIEGARRAETLDEALALRADARAAEEAGELERAGDLYRRLLALDPAMPGVEGAIDRVSKAIVDRNFRTAMSDGLAAMEIQDWAGAEKAFKRALGIRPGDPAPGAYLAEVKDRARRAVIESHRAKARAAMEEEQWARAVAHYEAVLKREPQARFAQEGLERAQRRLRLDEMLQQFIDAPEDWWSESGRRKASNLLARARGVPDPGPRLARQVRTLAEQIELASRPVDVVLLSDNSCNVVVYKVARLGTFERRELNLKPGRYTVVGTRDGYRDVRKEFLVPAGREPAPVELRCEEPV